MAFCKACVRHWRRGVLSEVRRHQGAVAPAAAVGSSDSPTAGIDENVAGLLCYLFHWLPV